MISDFPSDPMHLIFLVIINKIVVSLWCCGKPKQNYSFVKCLKFKSKLLINQRENISSKFNRKSRLLFESKRWKATEFRTFLLYTEQFILKQCGPDNCCSLKDGSIIVIKNFIVNEDESNCNWK